MSECKHKNWSEYLLCELCTTFKEKTNDVKNKYLAKYIGADWHEKKKPFLCTCGYKPDCPSGKCKGCMMEHYERISNPDYFTLEGRQQLLEWASKQDWFDQFIWENLDGYHESEPSISISLLIPVDVFANAIYKYLKETDLSA